MSDVAVGELFVMESRIIGGVTYNGVGCTVSRREVLCEKISDDLFVKHTEGYDPTKYYVNPYKEVWI